MTSPALTLISHPLCPFVQRAAIVLLEKGVPFERVDVDLNAKPDWFLALSPTGKVPLLKVTGGNGAEATLFESIPICEYLDETQAGPRLHPSDPLDRAQHRAWVEFGSAALTDAWGYLNAKDEETVVTKRNAFRDKLLRFEDKLGAGPFFGGSAISMVDAVVAPIFRYFDVLGDDATGPIFEGLPQVARWRAVLAERPSVLRAVVADYGDRFRAHLLKQGARAAL